jgi:hypothetical protein
VLHVADITINLMSCLFLSKNSFKLVFKSDKFILFNTRKFIGEGYLSWPFQNAYNDHC